MRPATSTAQAMSMRTSGRMSLAREPSVRRIETACQLPEIVARTWRTRSSRPRR